MFSVRHKFWVDDQHSVKDINLNRLVYINDNNLAAVSVDSIRFLIQQHANVQKSVNIKV